MKLNPATYVTRQSTGRFIEGKVTADWCDVATFVRENAPAAMLPELKTLAAMKKWIKDL